MSNGQEPLSKRRRRVMMFDMVPDDLVLECLARVSKLHYPILSLVSKRFRSLLASTELYQARMLLGRTESCLYVCLRILSDTKLRWFTLCRRPNSLKKVMVPVSSPDFLPGFVVVAQVSHDIYVISYSIDNKESSSVMVMDCRSHTWRKAPSMRVARWNPSTCVLDGKIYVVGGIRKGLDPTNWMEVFDTKTQIWEFVVGPSEKICRVLSTCDIIGYDGNIYVKSLKTLETYELYKSRWRRCLSSISKACGPLSSFWVIDNILYCSCHNCILWFDFEEKIWKKLEGLKELFRVGSRYDHITPVSYGGKMAILWQENVYPDGHRRESKIWCTQVNIEKGETSKIQGTCEWFDVVSTTYEQRHSDYSELEHVFAATL